MNRTDKRSSNKEKTNRSFTTVDHIVRSANWCSKLVLLLVFCLLSCSRERETGLPENQAARTAKLEEVKQLLLELETAPPSRIEKLLKHPDPRVRARAAMRLGQLRPAVESSVRALIHALKDDVPKVRIRAAMALADAGSDTQALEPLVAALADGEPTVRTWIGKAIRKFGEKGAAVLVQCMASNSFCAPYSYRNLAGKKVTLARAAKDLLPSYGKLAVPVLVRALQTETDKGIIYNVPGVLGKMGAQAKDALPALIEKLKTADEHLRTNIVADIGKIGDLHPDVVPALEAAQKDASKKVAREARRALAKVKKSKPKPKPKPKSKKPDKRKLPKPPSQRKV